MGQFVFLFFRDKAESADAVVERSYNFINSLFICVGHVEVALFVSILRNEVEEEFAGVFFKVKCDIEDAFREAETEADAAGELIHAETAMAIVEQRYPVEYPFLGEIRSRVEAAVHEEGKRRALKESMMVKSKRPGLKLRAKAGEEEEPPKWLQFEDFVRIVMRSELKNRRIFTSYLASEFKKADSSNFGFVSRKKFISVARGIFRRLGKKVDPKKMLMKREGFDPFVVTFSDAVQMFEKKKIKHDNVSHNLLEIMNLSIAS